MKLAVDHTTRYTYETPVRFSTQYLRLVPRDSARQKVIQWTLEAPGKPTRVVDGYGNVLHVLTIDKPVTEIVIRAVGVVQTTSSSREGPDMVPLPPLIFTRMTPLTQPDAALTAFAQRHLVRSSPNSSNNPNTKLRQLAAAILRKMPFQPGETQVTSSAAEAFAAATGVCQDHAHVFIACCRAVGIPARYVSGYVFSAGHEDAHVSSHAWAEAWVGDRWRSFDVANTGPAGEDHIKLAIGADYLEACPIRGVRAGGGEETMSALAQVAQQQ